MGTYLLEDFYVGVLLTLIILVVSRNFKISVWFYILHSILISFIYVWYAIYMNNPWFYLWFLTTIITQVILIPFAPGGFFYTIKKCGHTEVEPIIPFGFSLFFISILVAISWKFFHFAINFIAPIPSALVEPSKSNLAIAFTIFTLGIFTLLSRKDAIKITMALCIIGNSADLVLIDLAPGLNETAALGILTDSILSIFILLFLSRVIYDKFGVIDTLKLSELRY
jgi:hydrogenase-4 component E